MQSLGDRIQYTDGYLIVMEVIEVVKKETVSFSVVFSRRTQKCGMA